MTEPAGQAAAAAGTLLLYVACGLLYLLLAVLVLARVLRGRGVSRGAGLLAAAAMATAAWAAACAGQAGRSLAGPAASLDLLRGLAWYGFALHLFRQSTRVGTAAGPRRLFTGLGLVGGAAVAAAIALGVAGAEGVVTLATPGLGLRLALAVCQLLLLENLYRNARAEQRWNLNLACIGLGGVAAFDLLLCTDAALFHRVAATLVGGRVVAALLVCPLLAVAAARNRAWSVDIHVSRSVVFHSASLVISGLFLLAVAASGEVLHALGVRVADAWGGVVQVALLFAAVLALAVLLTSGTARSQLRRLLVDHFFSSRYDYRQEWLRCIETLSDEAGQEPLETRVVRAVAQVVDSPAGLLLLAEPQSLAFRWSRSWNLPPLERPLPPDHALLPLLRGGRDPVPLTPLAASDPALARLWLAVPLHQAGALAGCVLLAPPRAPFRLDAEVFTLLRTVAQEVATYLAEARATRVLLETRELRDYGERFAFVAHDIKNVSSQLSMLLANAETHLANPEFQRDMLATIAASVRRIGGLIQRLQAPEQSPAAGSAALAAVPPTIRPAERLEALASRARSLCRADIRLPPDADATAVTVAMDAAVFDTIVTHLLDNAIEAGGHGMPVHLVLRTQAGRPVLDVIDSGPGMTAEFVRDQLFRPFRTSKDTGSGIGAFQARALLRAAGGDLLVMSVPGRGTTMRLLLPPAAGVGTPPLRRSA